MQKFQFWPDLKKRSRAPPGGPWWAHNIFQMHVYWRTIFIPRNSPRCHWPIFRVKKWPKSKSGASSINQRLFTDDVIYDVNFSLFVPNIHSVWIWQWIETRMKRPPRGGAKWPFWKKKIEFSYFAVACCHHVVDASSESQFTLKFKLKVCLLQTNKNWRHQWRHFWIIDDRWTKRQIWILAIFWPLNFLGNDNDNFDACITDAWTVLIHASKLWLPLPIKC